ncbi:glycine/D-amino acid oxidase-like deaminating enzyme [Streptomyces olivoverticillatus]|uniref:Glycine/D-amino acid oxidase-like deaminating enzyme n=1 Tax=Streptomyces olivoverticillatus TaxID=66427 RepID=A0A7W7LR83_9ACTN|nr:FAD-dependent oxidoreductase [Streptomyces olivoverticillatus]MBB4894822.1 glycine/D-amino acid oxidase-like deaminating enzyme [Streptomyces olivoverticillatus]
MRVLGEGVDVVVVGGGIVGAACAEALTRRGVRVLLAERGPLAGQTTARGDGRLLISDKPPGPGLTLAMASLRRWPLLLAALREELGPARAACEYERKGGLAVAVRAEEAAALRELAAAQRSAGADARELTPDEAIGREPHLTPAVRAAVHYPEDARLQPVLAATALLAAVRARGGEIRTGVHVLSVLTGADGWVVGVQTPDGPLPCGAVVNAGGPRAGTLAEAAGASLPVLPRYGTVLVTAPLPPGTVRHTVHGTVAGGPPVVVGAAPGGQVLISSGRRRAGADEALRADDLRALARCTAALFPVLAGVPVLRAYGGFHPGTPDGLPVIGEDPRHPGLWHAAGHAGAGVALAAATGELLGQLFTGEPPLVDPEPFRVARPGLGLAEEENRCP